jgi:hypothetical protein
MKTASISTKWIVEVYPFKNSVPSPDDFLEGVSNKFAVTGSRGSNEFIKKLESKGLIPPGAVIENLGVTSVSINRSKSSPSGQATIITIGPLASSLVVGSWVVISTASRKSGKSKYLMRFIGQIQSLDITYGVEESGLQTTLTQIIVREWSYGLTVPVKYDAISIQAGIIGAAQFVQNVSLKAISGGGNRDNAATQLQNLMAQSYDPYQVSELVLKLIGAVNSDDITNKVDLGADNQFKFPGVAMQMPSVPRGILQRLGLEVQNPKSPFSTGFVKVMSGVQSEPVYSKDNWDGIWKSSSLDAFKNILEEGYKKINIRPSISGLGALLQNGTPAWDILSRFSENALNECFTDIWYEEGEEGDIVGKPVIVIRDKPFLLKSLKEKPAPELASRFGSVPDLSGWTLYDDLPRLYLPSEQIASFRVGVTSMNSPNYINVEYESASAADRITAAKSSLAGVARLGNEMERFGAHIGTARTIYMGLSSPRDNNPNSQNAKNVNSNYYEEYFGVIKGLFAMWHAYNYRMGNGQITLKDDNIPVSLGTNIQFEIGAFTLCAHVDSVSYTYQIGSDGLETSVCIVSFSRMVRVDTATNDLVLLNPEDFGNLTHSKSASPSILPNVNGGKLPGIAGNFSIPKFPGLS